MNILFLGDSITDCEHCFTADNLGNGFVKKLSLFPGITATNGGTDGFTFPRILQKWQKMYAQNQYDVVVITGGINETGILADIGLPCREADLLLERSMHALALLLDELSRQGTKRILLIEPFLFPFPGYRSLWIPVLKTVRRNMKKTVSAFDPDTVRLLSVQEKLDTLAGQIGCPAVTTDGIHLTDAGHDCLAGLLANCLAAF